MEEVKLILWNFRGNNTKKQNNQENSFSGFEDIYDLMETTAAASVIISKTGTDKVKTDAEEMKKQPPNKSNNNQSQPSIVKINKSQKYLKTRNPGNNKRLVVDGIYCYPSLLGGNHINFQFMNQYSTTNHNTFQTQQQQLNKPKNQHHNIKQTRKITLTLKGTMRDKPTLKTTPGSRKV
ncbi:hypothetical protein ACTA71_012331 [Dictyostelium dimigraforme]